MGYIIPVNSIQSQQYANRMMGEYNFATVQRLQPVKLNSDFQESFEESIVAKQANQEVYNKKSALASSDSQSKLKGYTRPNPANLSPAISKVVGKGAAINTYI